MDLLKHLTSKRLVRALAMAADKAECNLHRSADNESNCVGKVMFVDSSRTAGKACVPPSSGI
ncbi:MAG: hypothetical protein ABIS92_15065 [Polyangia bacterium]